MMFILEQDLLKAKPSADLDGDSWPEFSLTNAEVRDATTGEIVDFFLINEHRPVTVTGRLGNLNQQQAHLLLRNQASRNPAIQIRNVIRYAYGEYVDGEFAIWISGAAGWYKLEPSRSYRPVFQGMIEAIKVLYFVADICSDPPSQKGRKRAPPSANAIFAKFAQDKYLGCHTRDAAAALFSRHRQFLLISMLTGKENVQWHRQPIFAHLKEQYPDDLNVVKEMMEAPKTKQKAIPQRSGIDRSLRSSQSSELIARETASVDGLRTPVSISSQSSRRVTRRSRPPSSSTDLVSVSQLVVLSDTSSNEDPVGPIGPAHEGKGKGKSTGKGKGKGKGKSKSTLRPKSTRLFAKGTKASSESSVPEEQSDDGTEEVDFDIVELAGSTKRKIEELGESGNKSRKRTVSCDRSSNMDEVEPSADLPLRCKDELVNGQTLSDSGFVPIILSAVIPSTEPNEPGGTWLCRFDGCVHRVYGATSETGQELINEHHRSHVAQSEEQIELIKREARPHLPVSNLIKRIRELAEKQPGLHAQMAKLQFPMPIERRY